MATAAELTGEEIAAVAESLSDPANLNVDTMAAIMHRIGPGLMALGQKVLVALIIFLIGRKVISMIEKMLSRSMEHAGMDVGVTRFLRALTQFVMNVFLLFMIAGQLGMDSASLSQLEAELDKKRSWRGRACAEFGAPAESWKLCGRTLDFNYETVPGGGLYHFPVRGGKGFDGRAGLHDYPDNR